MHKKIFSIYPYLALSDPMETRKNSMLRSLTTYHKSPSDPIRSNYQILCSEHIYINEEVKYSLVLRHQ